MFKLLVVFASLVFGVSEFSYPEIDQTVQPVPNWSASFPLIQTNLAPITTQCITNNSWGLSFDDGPSISTRNVLASLAKSNLKATFFVVGSRILQHPDILQEMYLAGHEIAVHTWSHPDLTSVSNGQIIAELLWTMKIIKQVIGVVPRLMRPPFGAVNVNVQQAVAALGMSISFWSQDTLDYTFQSNATNTKLQVLMAFRNWTLSQEQGPISLEHDLADATTLYIDDVISIIQNAHYFIMPVSQCINVCSFTRFY